MYNLNFTLGWTGAGIILLFTINSCYGGTRLGLCTNILMERYDEFRHEIRDPYPSIGEKAFGKIGRYVMRYLEQFAYFYQ